MGVFKSLKAMGWLNAAFRELLPFGICRLSVVMVDAASLLAARSKSLSTFVSAKEKVLTWRWQVLETGGVNLRHWAELSLTKVMLLH